MYTLGLQTTKRFFSLCVREVVGGGRCIIIVLPKANMPEIYNEVYNIFFVFIAQIISIVLLIDCYSTKRHYNKKPLKIPTAICESFLRCVFFIVLT